LDRILKRGGLRSYSFTGGDVNSLNFGLVRNCMFIDAGFNWSHDPATEAAAIHRKDDLPDAVIWDLFGDKIRAAF
jgi:hypothetical protein